jgi:hypothetical protein
MTLLVTDVKLKLVIQLAKWTARATPTPKRAKRSRLFIRRSFWKPLLNMKKGKSIRDDRVSLQVAIAIGGASVRRIRMEAVETATRLTINARLGENPGFSPKSI